MGGTYRRWGIISGGMGGGGYMCVLSKEDMLRGGGDVRGRDMIGKRKGKG